MFNAYTYIIYFSHFVFIGYICFSLHTLIVGRDRSVGVATGYGLDSPGSNPGGGENFRNCTDRPWGPPSLLYNGYRVFPGVKSGRGVTLTPHPLLVPW